MEIQFISHSRIDKALWNKTIQESPNGLIYATTEFLDRMSPGWNALVSGNYDIIMPLTVKNKFGFSRLVQPAFSQQLGVFSKIKLEETAIKNFIQKASEDMDETDIYLNYDNLFPGAALRCNLVLPLHKSFEEISANFKKDLMRNATDHELYYIPAGIDEVFSDYEECILPKNKSLKKSALGQFRNLCADMDRQNKVISRKVISKTNDKLSSALFLQDEKRIYYMMAATSAAGKKCHANAYLLHEMIREHSGINKLFDFEGSEIPGVRFFFEKFGPVNQPYPHVHLENLNGWQKPVKYLYQVFKNSR